MLVRELAALKLKLIRPIYVSSQLHACFEAGWVNVSRDQLQDPVVLFFQCALTAQPDPDSGHVTRFL